MPVQKLTKKMIDSLTAIGGRRAYFYDADLKGFGVCVQPGGAKSWFVEYRAGRGRSAPSRRMTIGRVGTLTPDEARNSAKRILADAVRGHDPARKTRSDEQRLTVGQLVDFFFEKHVNIKRKSATQRHYRALLERYFLPAHGSRPAHAVTRADVAKIHFEMRNAPFQANRLIAVIGSLYSFAERRGLVPEGYAPAKRIERFPEPRRERFLTMEELGRIGVAVRLALTEGILNCNGKRERISPAAAGTIRLLLLTGCRVSEILALRWSDIDFQRGYLFLRDSKTGAKTVVLNASAISLLERLPRYEDNPFVFAGQKGGTHLVDIKRPWSIVGRHAGLKGVRIHDFRHTFASVAAGANLGLPVIGKLLGHTQAATTQRYAHLDTDPLRRATEMIGASIAAALDRVESS